MAGFLTKKLKVCLNILKGTVLRKHFHTGKLSVLNTRAYFVVSGNFKDQNAILFGAKTIAF
jgi:hypothetical protein